MTSDIVTELCTFQNIGCSYLPADFQGVNGKPMVDMHVSFTIPQKKSNVQDSMDPHQK